MKVSGVWFLPENGFIRHIEKEYAAPKDRRQYWAERQRESRARRRTSETAPTTKENLQSIDGERERVKTKQDNMTAFGQLIEDHRKRVGLSQAKFAEAMTDTGYPSYAQRTHSHLLYNPMVRIYPSYFRALAVVLWLSPNEEDELVRVWRSMSTI